jgi:23S rRNA (guanosine2251-2'-O)-methyltransferase
MDNSIVFGIHPVSAVLEREPENILSVWLLESSENKARELAGELENLGIKIQLVKRKTLDSMTDGANHQGIVIKIKSSKQAGDNDLLDLISGVKKPFILILDDVTDPHNLGACLRSADGAGVTAVVVSKDHAAGLNGTVRKVACGAAESVPFFTVTNISRIIKALKELGVWIVGTAGEAEKLVYDVDLSGPVAIVMGAEDKGMRRLTRENCDELVKLPMNGSVSSLNVSVATGIVLYEALRQRTVSAARNV